LGASTDHDSIRRLKGVLPTKKRVAAPKGSDGRSVYDVAVLQKALDVLEVLSQRTDLGLSELSLETGVSKASTYRVLSTLEARGFVTKDPETRKYSPGVKLIALSCAVVAGVDLVAAARPYVVDLQATFDETVNVGILANGEVLYVDIVESAQGLRMAAAVGDRNALHSTALGKAILSALPASEARELLTGYRRLAATPKTIVGLEALMDDLAACAARGYSIDDEENEVGARCVGVPVRNFSGRAVGAISISGPVARIPFDLVERIGARLQEAAVGIEERMGYIAAPATVATRARLG
jgi:IclR family acetate operon transcriptional repressor